MEVRSVVGRSRFGEHADDDPKEPGNLWHGSSRSSEEAALGFAMTNALSAVHLALSRCGSHGVTLRLWLSSGQRADLDTRGLCATSPSRLSDRACASDAWTELNVGEDGGASVEYVLGLPGNSRLDKRVRRLLGRARVRARSTGETVTLYGETRYAARRWDRKRRIIMKAEVLWYPGRAPKDNPRFLVTNLPQRPATVYTRFYCGRGDMETRLKELQAGVAMDRASCSRFAANHLRLLLSVAAYVLFQVLQLAARATALGAAPIWILRERLLKVAVWVERSVRRIVLHLPQLFPWREAWQHLAHALGAT